VVQPGDVRLLAEAGELRVAGAARAAERDEVGDAALPAAGRRPEARDARELGELALDRVLEDRAPRRDAEIGRASCRERV